MELTNVKNIPENGQSSISQNNLGQASTSITEVETDKAVFKSEKSNRVYSSSSDTKKTLKPRMLSGSQSRSSNIRDRIESQETNQSSIFGTSPHGADDLLSDIMKDMKPKTNVRTEYGSK